MAERLYQTLPDALNDFDDRGISGHITMNMGSRNKTYELDATDGNRLSQMDRLAKQLNEISQARDHKIIAFTGKTSGTGSGNQINITTSEAGLPTVVSLFAQTSRTNVPLTINGTDYNFTPASQRCQVGCSNTASVALSAISENVKATWKAMPHENTTLSGFTVQGEGDLSEMTIANSGSETDSIAYLVTLSTPEGQKLCEYTYYIYVYALMQNQTFTNLTPVSGSSVDPVATKLTWNAFNDATSYRIVVNEAAEGGEPAEIVNKVVDATDYEVTVKTGCTYTWTVTAIGPCDELTSPTMTLKGRLLPDLVVESITLPEAAPAGTELTVTATIKNQGTGATTEEEWTDRLYYTINSTKWADAVQAADVTHQGNVDIDGSYQVTFNMIVPDVDSGTLRVFVETNVGKTAMEANTGNNYTISSTSATMTPVYLNADDRTALRQLYQDLGGSEWNGTKWNVESELISSSNWSGVTFDSDGRVKAIDLKGRNLAGSLSTATPLSLPRLTTLNLSRNALTGDPSKFISIEKTPLLTTLDLGYNQIDELSAPLPSAITTLTLISQHRTYNKNAVMKGLENLEVQTINVGKNILIDIPAIVGYNHSKQTFGNIQTLNIWKSDMSTRYGSLEWSNTYEHYAYKGYVTIQPQDQDENVMIVPADGAAKNSAYPGCIHMIIGDANLSGLVDVNDVQRTLNYVINNNNTSTFSLWAANTWDIDDIINIQDIVCTVNIVLENQGDQLYSARSRTRQANSRNLFYASGRSICLEAQNEIAAFDLMLEGVNSSQVRLLLNSNDWQMQTRETEYGTRLVVFSPTGQTLPTGGTPVLRMSADGMPIGVQATDVHAEEVVAGVNATPTGITVLEQDGDDGCVYDLMGRKVKEHSGHKTTGIYIKNGKKVMKSWK